MDNHDPAAIVLTIGGNLISGFMPGTFLEVERDEDTWTPYTGADGEVARVRNNNRTGRFTFRLMPGSASNQILSAMATLDEQTRGGAPAGASYVRDLLGTTILGGDESYILKPAAAPFGTDLQGREWVVIVPRLDGVVGASL